jgi:hypothetical protein
LDKVPGNVVLLFEADGIWNLNGTADLLNTKRKEPGYSYVLFVDGTIGRYRFSGGLVLESQSAKNEYLPLRRNP